VVDANLTTVDFDDLTFPMPALTEAFGKMMAEAASVCFDACGHETVVRMLVQAQIDGTWSRDVEVHRWPVDDHMRRSFNDLEEAVEYGSYGLAILLIKKIAGFAVVERSAQGTGIDYWLGDHVEGAPIQSKARLEVSGILRGTDSVVRRRINDKVAQATANSSPLPTYVVVVRYQRPDCTLVKP
jgi:hypothetical protein